MKIPKSMKKKKGHPLGWDCPDCGEPLQDDYDDATTGALTVCMKCLAIISSESGIIKLQPYEDLSVETRAMIITGINMSLSMMAARALSQIADEASDN